MGDITETAARILLVEDDQGLRTLIETRLRRLGHTVESVSSGAQAIAWVREQPCDLMLLDYSLPDMTGEEAIAKLSEQGNTVPFIVITGHGSEAVAVQMMKLGARDYLIKDSGFLELMPAIVARARERVDQERRLQETETALRQSEEFHRTILEAMPAGVLKVTPDGRIVYANAEARRFMHLSETDARLTSAVDLQRRSILEDWTPCAARHHPLTRCLSSGKPEPARTLGLRHRDGSLAWALYTATPLVEPRTQTLIAAVLSFVDISHRKQVEEALRQTFEETEKEVQERAAKLKAMQRRMQQESLLRQQAERQVTVERSLRQISKQFWTLAGLSQPDQPAGAPASLEQLCLVQATRQRIKQLSDEVEVELEIKPGPLGGPLTEMVEMAAFGLIDEILNLATEKLTQFSVAIRLTPHSEHFETQVELKQASPLLDHSWGTQSVIAAELDGRLEVVTSDENLLLTLQLPWHKVDRPVEVEPPSSLFDWPAERDAEGTQEL